MRVLRDLITCAACVALLAACTHSTTLIGDTGLLHDGAGDAIGDPPVDTVLETVDGAPRDVVVDPSTDTPTETPTDLLDADLAPLACTPRIFFLVDGSGGMTTGGYSRWEAVRDALVTVLSSDLADGVEFGLGTFPSDGGCGVEALVVHPLPELTLETLSSSYPTPVPEARTPLVAAMQQLVTSPDANLRPSTGHEAIVLITEADDTCRLFCEDLCAFEDIVCRDVCTERERTYVTEDLVEATDALVSQGIRVFVVGVLVFGDEYELSTIGSHGGTAATSWLPVETLDELRETLLVVIEAMRYCAPVTP